MRKAGNRFLNPVPLSDLTFTACDPYPATLGILISTKNGSWAEGTSRFYLSVSSDNKDIYLSTAQHIVLPLDMDDNNISKTTKNLWTLATF